MVLTLNAVVSENVKEFYVNHASAYEGDVGIDLFIPHDVNIPAKSTYLIDLEISCELMKPSGSVLDNGEDIYMNLGYLIYPRSSISKTPLRLSNSVGVVDAKYRHTLKISLDNLSNNPYNLVKGQRLVQIVSGNLESIKFNLVDKLSESNRGEGFGSSGINGKVLGNHSV